MHYECVGYIYSHVDLLSESASTMQTKYMVKLLYKDMRSYYYPSVINLLAVTSINCLS